MRYLVALIGKDPRTVTFLFVEASSPNEALAKYGEVQKVMDPEEWKQMAMETQFVSEPIEKDDDIESFWDKPLAWVHKGCNEKNTYDYVVVEHFSTVLNTIYNFYL